MDNGEPQLQEALEGKGRNNPILLKDCLQFEPVPLEPKIAVVRRNTQVAPATQRYLGGRASVVVP